MLDSLTESQLNSKRVCGAALNCDWRCIMFNVSAAVEHAAGNMHSGKPQV
jgi:hypothetical protein